MSFSKSKAKTSTSSTNTSRNLNIQDVEGVTAGEVGGDFNFTEISTDMNAFGEASALARKSLDVGESIQRESFDFASRFLAQSQETLSDVVSRSQDTLGGVLRDVLGRAQESLGSTVTALNTIAREDSKSGDERIAEITGSAQKQIVLIIGIVAAAILGYVIFRKA